MDWDAILENHYERIARAALLLTGDAWEAEDLAQETFLEAIRTERRFVGRSQLGTWLYAILVNRHRKRQRGLARHWQRCRRWFQAFSARPAVPTPEVLLQQREWQASLWKAVARLSEAQRQAIVLRYSEGLSYEEIAEVLHCPLSTVRSRLSEGLKSLRRCLGPSAAKCEVPVACGGEADHDSYSHDR